MKVKDVYEQYEVMPTLAQHMRMVGAVAKILTDQVTEKDFPAREIVTACLLHDMGNIVKFNLDKIPTGLHISDIDHWKMVQKKMREKYGMDEHDVTRKMVVEMGVSEIILNAVSHCGSTKAKHALETKNVPAMFVTYCDYHIAPTSVVTIESRIADILERYKNTPEFEGYKRYSTDIRALAHYLESRFMFDTTKLTTEQVRTLAEELNEWNVV
jgi:hypothetical protein